MKNFFIGVFVAVGATVGLLLPMILGYALLFSGFRTAGTVVALTQPLWVFPWAAVAFRDPRRKA